MRRLFSLPFALLAVFLPLVRLAIISKLFPKRERYTSFWSAVIVTGTMTSFYTWHRMSSILVHRRDEYTLGGRSRTSTLSLRKKYGVNLLCKAWMSSGVSSSCCLASPSRSSHFSGSIKFIRLNNSLMLLFKGVWHVCQGEQRYYSAEERPLTPVIMIRW